MDKDKYPDIYRFINTDLVYRVMDDDMERSTCVLLRYQQALQELRGYLRELVSSNCVENDVSEITASVAFPFAEFDILCAITVDEDLGFILGDKKPYKTEDTYVTPIGLLTAGMLEHLRMNQDSPFTQFVLHLYRSVVWVQLELKKLGIEYPYQYTKELLKECNIEDALYLHTYITSYTGLGEMLLSD